MIRIKNVVYLQHLKKSMNKSFLSIFIVILTFFLMSCSSNKPKEGEILETKRLNPNLVERAKENAAKNPLFDSSRNKSSGTFQFGTSNILWRATLKTLEFIPLNNTDYAGGVIVTDWYGNADEQIKISIQFLSNELNTTSIKVIAHKKLCKQNNCQTEPANENFNAEVKENILNRARDIKINDEKNK